MADLDVVVVQRLGRVQVMGVPGNLSVNLQVGEKYRLGDDAARIFDVASVGELAFMASPDHAILTRYVVQVRVYGSSTVVATQDLGLPTPSLTGIIVTDATSALTAAFNAQGAGNYTISVRADAPGGSADSAESDPFSLPLQ